jgi:hypothetical protein
MKTVKKVGMRDLTMSRAMMVVVHVFSKTFFDFVPEMEVFWIVGNRDKTRKRPLSFEFCTDNNLNCSTFVKAGLLERKKIDGVWCVKWVKGKVPNYESVEALRAITEPMKMATKQKKAKAKKALELAKAQELAKAEELATANVAIEESIENDPEIPMVELSASKAIEAIDSEEEINKDSENLDLKKRIAILEDDVSFLNIAFKLVLDHFDFKCAITTETVKNINSLRKKAVEKNNEISIAEKKDE